MNRQKVLWRQKSRELWLATGDLNSKFFHAAAVSNKMKIFIATLKNSNGEWMESRETIGGFLIEEFTKLFHTDHMAYGQFLENFFRLSITEDQNNRLHAIPIDKEILHVVNILHLIKAPGPDVMPALFFQYFWKYVGKDVIVAI